MNPTPPPTSETADGPSALGAANALTAPTAPGQWLKLADYGDWPHPAGLQRFTQQSAAAMVRSFQSLWGRLRRRFGGVPMYIGHPDDPAFAGQPGHDDTRAYAWITALEARPDGLHILPRWSEPGRDLLRHAFYKFLSPRWQMRPLGHGVFEPVSLLSVGLTNHPNIPGESLANQKMKLPDGESAANISIPSPAGAPETSDPKSEIPLAGPNSAVSDPKPPTPNSPLPLPTDFLSRLLEVLELDAAAGPDTVIANAENLAQAARDTRAAQVESARFYRLATDADQARQVADTRANEEHAGRVELLLDLAELRGRIPPAARAQWRDQLAANFDQGRLELANAPATSSGNSTPANSAAPASCAPGRLPPGGVAPVTARLASRRPGAQLPARTGRFLTLVNERMSRTGEDYPTAWARTRRDHAAIFNS